MADMTFEAKFAQLAGNQLSDKLPSMLPYFVGFQLLDKADDETRAVGINVFVVNGLWIYNPVFFLKGDIKGLQDLLFVKQKNMFVPAMDNWISALKDQGLDSLTPGKAKKNTGRGGSKNPKEKSFAAHQIPFDEMLFSSSSSQDGMGKTGSAANDMVTEEDFKMMTKLASTTWELGLDTQLSAMPKYAQDMFFNTLTANADFANAVLKFYSPDSINGMASMMKTAATVVKNESTSPAEDKLLVVDSMSHPDAKKLSTAEKKLLTQNGVFVRDNRSNHSLLFKTEVKQSALENPTASGVYDVLQADGSMKPYIVFVGVHGLQAGNRPCCKTTDGNSGREVALIPLSDTTTFTTENASKLFVRPVNDKESYKKVTGRVGRVATKRAWNTNTDGSYGEILMVQPSTQSVYVFGRTGNTELRFHDTETANSVGRSDDSGCLEPQFTGEVGKLYVQGGVVVIPKDVKIFTQMKYSDKPNFGDMNTINRMVFKEAEMHPLQVIVRASGVTIRSEKINQTMDKTAAIRHLVEKEGITGQQAFMSIHHDVAGKPDGSVKYFIKYAFDYDVNNNQDIKQNINRNEETGPVETISMQAARPVMPADAVQQAVKASENGNRQVFDVTVLNNLVQSADVSELRKSFIVDMMKGMDKTGRLLFIYYWHNDQFSERFGKEDLASLEDKIRQVFRNTGDLILYLKEKMPLETGTQEHILGNLSEDIGSAEETDSKS